MSSRRYLQLHYATPRPRQVPVRQWSAIRIGFLLGAIMAAAALVGFALLQAMRGIS